MVLIIQKYNCTKIAQLQISFCHEFYCCVMYSGVEYVVCCSDRGFDSHRGQADFSACLVWDIHSE